MENLLEVALVALVVGAIVGAFLYLLVMRAEKKLNSPRMTSSTLSGESLEEMKARMRNNSRCGLKLDRNQFLNEEPDLVDLDFEDRADVEVCPISKRLPSTPFRGITGTPFPQNPDTEYAPFEDREVDICETLVIKQ